MTDKPKEPKRVTVEVGEDLHKAAKVKAAEEGTTLSDKLRELLSDWTGEEDKGKKPKKINDPGK